MHDPRISQALTRTDGRWGRILHTLDNEGAMSFDELFPRVRDTEHSYKVDRQKCFNAMWGLRREGLVEGDQRRLEITKLGRTTFADLARSEARLARDGFRVRVFAAPAGKLMLAASLCCAALALPSHSRAQERTVPHGPLVQVYPPAEFDHPPDVLPEYDYLTVDQMQKLCGNSVTRRFVYSCSVMTKYRRCIVYLPDASFGLVYDDVDMLKRHEDGHCNGWPADHPGAIVIVPPKPKARP